MIQAPRRSPTGLLLPAAIASETADDLGELAALLTDLDLGDTTVTITTIGWVWPANNWQRDAIPVRVVDHPLRDSHNG